MTTIAAGRLSETLQSLVDARLDTIDRMLLGRVNRHDRLAIVREVETQIFDLLQGRDTDSIDRDDVLAVLARLDPPEAYLPDEAIGEAGPVRVPSPRATRPVEPNRGPAGRVSGILGIVAVTLFCLTFFLLLQHAFWNAAAGYVVMLGLIFIHALLAVIFAARARLRGAWAVVGLVTGIISLMMFLLGTLEFL